VDSRATGIEPVALRPSFTAVLDSTFTEERETEGRCSIRPSSRPSVGSQPPQMSNTICLS
jgi:hypothetical protein